MHARVSVMLALVVGALACDTGGTGEPASRRGSDASLSDVTDDAADTGDEPCFDPPDPMCPCRPGDSRYCDYCGWEVTCVGGQWIPPCECDEKIAACRSIGGRYAWGACGTGECHCTAQGNSPETECCCPLGSPHCRPPRCSDLNLLSPDAGCPGSECLCAPAQLDGGICCCGSHDPRRGDAGADSDAQPSDAAGG